MAVKQTKITLMQVIDYMDRYGPLIEFLEQKRGFGLFVVQMHGRRPVKAGETDALEVLPVIEWKIDVSKYGKTEEEDEG